MTRNERRLVAEGTAITVAGLFGVYLVPFLISAHDSLALLAGVCLALGWVGWTAFYAYRIFKED